MTRDPHGKIFVSYRKKYSTWQALSVHYALQEKHNRDIWMDKNLVPGEDWLEKILSMIEASEHFLLILAPGSLARCRLKKDIFRAEIAHAIKTERNIVPLFSKFDWKLEASQLRDRRHWYGIPPEIRELSLKEGKSLTLKGFAHEISALNSASLSKASNIKTRKVSKPVADSIMDNVAVQSYDSPSAIPTIDLQASPDAGVAVPNRSRYLSSTSDFLDYSSGEFEQWLKNRGEFFPPPGLIASDVATPNFNVDFKFNMRDSLGSSLYVSIVGASYLPVNVEDVLLRFETGIKFSYLKLKQKYPQFPAPLPADLEYGDKVDYVFPFYYIENATLGKLDPYLVSGVIITTTAGEMIELDLPKSALDAIAKAKTRK